MKKFSELGVLVELPKSFVGNKIKMTKILNREIVIHDFWIDDTKIEDFSGKCLCLQITVDGDKRVVFTGATVLIQAIKKIPEGEFPFTTTIIEDDNERYFFS